MTEKRYLETRSVRFRVAPIHWRSALRASLSVPAQAVDKAALFRWIRELSSFYAGLEEKNYDFRLTKQDIAKVIPKPNSPGIYSTTTSGTTGRIVKVFYSPEEFRFKSELLYRPMDLYDLPTATNQLILLDIDEACRGPMIEQRGPRIYRSFLMSASAGTARQMQALREIRPEVLRGFPSAMVALAEAVPHRQLRALGVRYLSPSGEMLPRQWRDLLAEAFGGRVLDRYGATETGAIGWQCPLCDAYHANTDEFALETDAMGNLLVTPLFLVTQPLYRYELGDNVSIVEPDLGCSVRLHRMTINEARRDDWLIDGQQRKVSPLVFNFEKFAGVRTWKVHQHPDGAISLAVTGDDIDVAYLNRILDHVRQKVPGRPVRIEADPFRMQLRHGKFKRVSSEFQPQDGISDRGRA